jgi:hypothetical protein
VREWPTNASVIVVLLRTPRMRLRVYVRREGRKGGREVTRMPTRLRAVCVSRALMRPRYVKTDFYRGVMRWCQHAMQGSTRTDAPVCVCVCACVCVRVRVRACVVRVHVGVLLCSRTCVRIQTRCAARKADEHAASKQSSYIQGECT